MRIIKFSKEDEDFPCIDMAANFFEMKLNSTEPKGKFEITKGRISQNGLERKEKLVFSYNGQMIYMAEAATGRERNRPEYSTRYPNYFCIDMATLKPIKGKLGELEKKLQQKKIHSKNIVKSQGWPIIVEKETNIAEINAILASFMSQ